jgi:hypothetical protein
VSSGDRIPGGLSRVCCGARARRRVRVARWRRVVVGGCRRVPVPPVPLGEPSPGPRDVFGWRAVPFYVVSAGALVAQAVGWFVPVPPLPAAPGFVVLAAGSTGWLLLEAAAQFLFPRGGVS